MENIEKSFKEHGFYFKNSMILCDRMVITSPCLTESEYLPNAKFPGVRCTVMSDLGEFENFEIEVDELEVSLQNKIFQKYSDFYSSHTDVNI